MAVNVAARRAIFTRQGAAGAGRADARNWRQAASTDPGVIAMAYELDQFIADCRSILTHDGGPNGREEVRKRLEQLLHNTDFIHKQEQTPRGLHVLYEDPELGFQVLSP